MFFLLDKVPYLISIFVATAGWAVVHTVDRLVDSPAIEYKVTKQAVPGAANTWEVRASVANLSKKETFRDISFLFRVPKAAHGVEFLVSPDQRRLTRIVAHPPALEGEKSQVEVDRSGASFVLPVLAPGNRFDLVTRYRGVGDPVFMGMPGLSPGDSFALVQASAFTWVARNELGFLWGCLGLWLLAMGGYWCHVKFWQRKLPTAAAAASQAP